MEKGRIARQDHVDLCEWGATCNQGCYRCYVPCRADRASWMLISTCSLAVMPSIGLSRRVVGPGSWQHAGTAAASSVSRTGPRSGTTSLRTDPRLRAEARDSSLRLSTSASRTPPRRRSAASRRSIANACPHAGYIQLFQPTPDERRQ